MTDQVRPFAYMAEPHDGGTSILVAFIGEDGAVSAAKFRLSDILPHAALFVSTNLPPLGRA